MADTNGASGRWLSARTLAGLVAAVTILPALAAVLHPWRDVLALQSVLLVFLLAVLVVAVVGTLATALLAAVVAFLLVNWFYVPPYHTLVIEQRDNVVALVVFVAVAVVAAALVETAARQRAQAARAERERDTLGELTSIPLEDADCAAVLAHIRRSFALEWVALRGPDNRVLVSVGNLPRQGNQGGKDEALQGPAGDDQSVRVPAGEEGVTLEAHGAATLGLERRQLATLAAVAERARQAEQLVADAARLESADRARVALLAAVGHDLRTPLAAIKAGVSTLRGSGDAFTPDETAELLADVERGADRLEELISNLLALSRLQAGTLIADMAPVRLDGVISRALLDVEAGEDITVDVPEDLPDVQADAALLERVVANLLTNGLRHGGGRLEVTALLEPSETGSPRQVVVRIRDFGRGVPAAARATILQPFQRLDDSRSGGLGLGMAVVAGFCDAMAIPLRLLDTPGGGLTVELTLARSPEEGAP